MSKVWEIEVAEALVADLYMNQGLGGQEQFKAAAYRRRLVSQMAGILGERKDAEIERLTGIIDDDNAVCICGCPASEHEQYPEGESCEHEDHECIRVCHAARKIVARLTKEKDESEARAERLKEQLAEALG